MNTHRVIQVFFCNALQNCYSKALGYFTGVGTQIMESNNLIIIFFDHYLSITFLVFVIVKGPFQRFEYTSICNNVLFAKLFLSILLTPSTATIFNWGEDCCRNIFVAH